jgi:hypothetical protein
MVNEAFDEDAWIDQESGRYEKDRYENGIPNEFELLFCRFVLNRGIDAIGPWAYAARESRPVSTPKQAGG